MQLTLPCVSNITIVPGIKSWHQLSDMWVMSAIDGGHLLLKHTGEEDRNEKNAKSTYHLILLAETHQTCQPHFIYETDLWF